MLHDILVRRDKAAASNNTNNNDQVHVSNETQAVSNPMRYVDNIYVQDAHSAVADTEAFASTYRTARDIFLSHNFTVEDIQALSDKFWEAHMAASAIVDTAAATIATIHGNLCMGTIAPHAASQDNLQPLLEELKRFEVCGDFMLTEIGHGLDARNIETTATLSEDGKGFDLHTPSPAAAKSMPPATPLGGIPKIAVVFAKLIVEGKMHGIRTFVVRLTDGAKMRSGISTILLPQRPGNRALDHAITTFTHVQLNRNDLLGELDIAENQRQFFLSQIHRVSVGGLALSLANIPASKAAAYLCYSFSKHRKVLDANTRLPVSILDFPTQYGPIISTVAHAAVMEAAGRFFIGVFQMKGLPEMLRQALVCIFKATATYSTQRHLSELTDRCGWRGLFAYNKIAEIQLGLKGNSIAEGDVMVLCIRLASELLQSKYSLPPSDNPDSPLAKHEAGLLTQLRRYLSPATTTASSPTEATPAHRSKNFAQNVTPLSTTLVRAIGHRFAYDSVVADPAAAGVLQDLLDVWEADVMLQDAGWYIEHTGLTMAELQTRRVEAGERVLPHLEGVIEGWDMEKWFGDVPIVGKEQEDEFLAALPRWEGIGSKL